jgi:glycosidase
MNYNFAFAVNDFFIAEKRKISASGFVDSLRKIDKTYPEENLNLLQNLIDSHDTERLSSMILNPDRNFDRDANEGNQNYNPGKPGNEIYEEQKLIFAFQMTYRGAPMIYYGTEIGMWGADDPHCRKPMVWDDLKYSNEIITDDNGFKKGIGSFTVEQNKNLLEFYKMMIHLRNENLVLQRGNVNFLYTNDEKKSFAFEREFEKEKIIIAFNIGKDEDTFEVPVNIQKGKYEEFMTNEEGDFFGADVANSKILIKIPGQSFRIYKIYPTH